MLSISADGELACSSQSRDLWPKRYAACLTASDWSSMHSPYTRQASNRGVEARVDCSQTGSSEHLFAVLKPITLSSHVNRLNLQ